MRQALSDGAATFLGGFNLGRPAVSSRAVGVRWGLMLLRCTVLRLPKKRVPRRAAPGSEEGKGVSAHGSWLRAVRKERRRDARLWLWGGAVLSRGLPGFGEGNRPIVSQNASFPNFCRWVSGGLGASLWTSPKAAKIMPGEGVVALDPIEIHRFAPKLTFGKQAIRAVKREKPSL